MFKPAEPLLKPTLRRRLGVVSPWRSVLFCLALGAVAAGAGFVIPVDAGSARGLAFHIVLLCGAACVGLHTLWSP
jgi:hypothetical protein